MRKLKNEKHVISNISKIISLPNASDLFCLDSNLTKSLIMSNLKHQMTKCVNAEMQNLTKNVLDQKWSNLCVPISVTALLQFAIQNDLAFDDKYNDYTFEQILTTLTMIVYPRSLVGLNLNPKKEEKEIQENDVETLLQRICEKTFLMESGWEIVRNQSIDLYKPADSTCEFESGTFSCSLFLHKTTLSNSKRKLPLHSSFDNHRRLSSSRRYSFLPPDGARPHRRHYR